MGNIKRNAFCFYRSFADSLEYLPDDMAGRMIKAIYKFLLDGINPELEGTDILVWNAMKPNIMLSRAKAEAGSRGGRKRVENSRQERKQTQANPSTVNQTQADSSKSKQTQPYMEVGSRKKENGSRKMEVGISLEAEESASQALELSSVAYAPEDSSEAKTSDPASCSEKTEIVLSGTKKKEFDFTAFAKFFNKTMDEANATIPRVQKITGRRKDYIMARIREFSEDELYMVVRKAAVSDFLNGRNDRGWKADFSWMFLPNNFPKILEGNYDNDNRRNNQAGRSGATWPGGYGYGTKAEFNAEALRRTEASILRTLQGVEDPKPNF